MQDDGFRVNKIMQKLPTDRQRKTLKDWVCFQGRAEENVVRMSRHKSREEVRRVHAE